MANIYIYRVDWKLNIFLIDFGFRFLALFYAYIFMERICVNLLRVEGSLKKYVNVNWT